MGDEDNPVAPIVALPVAPEEPQLQSDGDCGMGRPAGSSSECYFCGQRVYVLERISAEGKFFHRSCFTCHHCGITLRLGGYTFHQSTGRVYCELHSEDEGTGNGTGTSSSKDSTRKHKETNGENDPTPSPSDDDDYEDEGDDDEYYLDCGPCKDTQPHQPEGNQDHNRLDCKDEPLEPPPTNANEEPEENPPSMTPPVPRPRLSRQNTPTPSTPVPKPRTVHLVNPSPPEGAVMTGSSPPVPLQDNRPDSRPKQKQKLQLSDAEKSQLVNLQSLSLDSDSETPGGSSSCSSSSATAGRLSPPKPTSTDRQEEEGYWSGSTTVNQKKQKNRRAGFKRKEDPGGQQTKVRSKFSPWNLSSPRLSREHRLSVLNSHPGRVETSFMHGHSTSEDGVDGDDDDDDDDEEMLGRDDIDLFHDKFQTMPSDPVEAEKMELKKMRTLERRAKMSELQRFRKAQSIQRRLEEIEVTFKELEEKGVGLERALRQETGNGGSPVMIDQWIELVHQKNGLVSEESDLMVASRQLELEDKQSMLELELRKYMEMSDSEKTAEQRAEEEHFLQQKIEVVDMRDALVAFLDEKRLKEISEEQAIFSIMEAKRHSTSAGAQVHWA